MLRAVCRSASRSRSIRLSHALAALLAVALSITTAACRTTSDTSVVKVQVGGTRYHIPRNSLLAMPERRGQSDGYLVTDGLNLVGAAPNFEGRSASNEAQFEQSGTSPRIDVVVGEARLGGGLTHARTAEYWMKGAQIEELGGRNPRRVIVTNPNRVVDRDRILDGEIWDNGEFTLCRRFNGRAQASCSHYYYDGDQILKIRFGRQRFDEREKIIRATKLSITSWIVRQTARVPG